jgi:hypothetical protein
MALSAGGDVRMQPAVEQLTVHIVYQDRLRVFRYHLDTRRSRAYLSDLLDDFMTPRPLWWLPFATVSQDKVLRAAVTADRIDAAARAIFFDILGRAYTEQVDIRASLAGAVVTPDILDRARRRFGALFP